MYWIKLREYKSSKLKKVSSKASRYIYRIENILGSNPNQGGFFFKTGFSI